MSIPAVESLGFVPFLPQSLPVSPGDPASGVGTVSAAAAGAPAGADFGRLLSEGLESLQSLHTRTDSLAVQAATGDLTALHDYTITATEAQVATQLTTAVRNKALEAFQEIMRMSV